MGLSMLAYFNLQWLILKCDSSHCAGELRSVFLQISNERGKPSSNTQEINMDHDICEVNRDAWEMSFEELEQVSGGDLLNMVISAGEKAAAKVTVDVAHWLFG
jgi:hypothetical protein